MRNAPISERSIRILPALLLAALLAASLARGQKNDQADVLFQAALHKQLVDGDLEEAIQQYKTILAKYGSNRAVAAKAWVEMGQCYEKLGNVEARKAYEHVLRDYADQNEAAAEARTRLAALGGARSTELVTRRVWAGADVDDEGAPSPDGKYLTYVDWDTGDLAAFDLVTGEKRRLTHDGTYATDNDFGGSSIPSPDGKHVAYEWYKDSKAELRIIGSDGSHLRTVYRNDALDNLAPKAWSPDGKQVLTVFGMKDAGQLIGAGAWTGTTELVMVGVADGSVHVLRNLEPARWRHLPMGFSPDGRYIAYTLPQKDDRARHDIFLLSADGDREVPLVTNPADDYFLGWALDGKTVFFASDRTGTVGVWAIDVLDGKPEGSPRMLKSDVGRIIPLGFTPKGSLYYALNSSISDLYTAAFDFVSAKVLVPPHVVTERSTGANAAPAWSPDGKYLAYLSQRHKPHGGLQYPEADTVVVRSVESGEEREIVPNLMLLNPRQVLQWFPNSRSLLVSGIDRNNHWGFFRVDAQTGEAVMIPQPPEGGCLFPRVTPDGRTLIYFSWSKVEQILAQDLEDGHVRQVRDLTPLSLSGLALSPDGRQIALAVQAHGAEPPTLNIMPAAGGEPRELYRPKAPADFGWNTLAWTPDGKYLVFGIVPNGSTASRQRTDLWEVSVEGGQAQKLDLTMDQVRQLRIHPGGQQIAFESGSSSFEIGVMENLLVALKAAR